MKKRFSFLIFIISLAGMLGTGCSGLRNLEGDEYLLNKSIIKTDHAAYKEDMTAILKQRPNRRILGLFRFHLGIYNLANQGDSSRFKNWVKNTIGEEPVLLDTGLTKLSSTQLKIYLQNKGYFNANVNDTTIYKRRHKANVFYSIKSGAPYKIKSVKYNIKSETVASFILSDSINCLLKPRQNYDESVISKERDRISLMLKNEGFYYFNPQYINFAVDSGLLSNEVIIYIQVANPFSGGKSGEPEFDKRYYINTVYVQTDYDPISNKLIIPTDTTKLNNFVFISSANFQLFKPHLLLQHVFIEPQNLFSQSKFELTYRRLQELGVFKFINIRYELIPGTNQLSCFILLTPMPRKDYKIEAEGTNSGGNIGIAGNVGFRNKNSFKGSELFYFRIKGGTEVQKEIADTSANESSKIIPFNAYEIGPEISLSVPRILFPGIKKLKFGNPETNFVSSFNYQQRPEFKRTLAILSIAYSWKETAFKRHYIYPAEVNFLRVKLQPAFEKKLNEIGDAALIKSYDDQLISGGRYSFVYNTQSLNSLRDYIYFRGSIETAGNTLWLANSNKRKKATENQRIDLFKVPYAQYIRPDFVIGYYQIFSSSTQLVYRLAAGVGYAYGNSELMPFEKSFYAGGANDMRAWQARSLGPGSYTNSQSFEKTGDIKINANLEYRFDIFRKLEGALFTDAGNIWLLKPDENRPNGNFTANFIDQVALGTGLGFRFDFTFFILRFDWGFKIKNPVLVPSEQWVIKNPALRNTVLNFGIGYPF